MAVTDCEVIPRRGATPEQLRALGGALAVWSRSESGDNGILHFMSRDALAELASGNPPSPFLEQYQEMLNESRTLLGDAAALASEQQKQERTKLKESFGEAGLRRTLYFQVRGAFSARRQIIASLRRHIPVELVDDILIADRSWEYT
jgi:hypothetical protein